ncbi:MAG TPA: hypothetical protein VKO18_16675 [Terriglobia bacterium]|nr:hypothetical protein [Terriglobia bacterium]
MEVIDRYVHEIGEHLPWNLRADVEAELRSLLQDSLEERARAAERPPDPLLAEAVIRDFGAPEEVAKRYLPQDQYLIGPRLFPAYQLAVKIAVIVVAAASGGLFIAAIVGSAVGNREGPDLLAVAHTIWRVAMGVFFNLALVTLVFAIIERVQARREATAPEWSPAMLPPVKDPDRTSQAGMVLQMYMILAFAVLFNFYPEWVGMAFVNGRVHLTSFLKPAFATYMPLVNTFWALDFALHLTVLSQGRWRRETRAAELALGLYGAVILYLVITGPPLFMFDFRVKAILKGVLALVLMGSASRLYFLLRRRA